jgi:hypothetical protein
MRFSLLLACAVLALVGCQQKAASTPDPEIPALQKQLNTLQAQVKALETQVFDLSTDLSTQATMLAARHPEQAVFAPDDVGYKFITLRGAVFLVSLDDVKAYADGQRLTFSIGNPQFATYSRPTVNVTWGKRFAMRRADRKLAPEDYELPSDEELAAMEWEEAIPPSDSDTNSINWAGGTVGTEMGTAAPNGREELDRPALEAAASAIEEAQARGAWKASLHRKEEKLMVELRPGTWTKVTIVVAPAASEEVGHIEFSIVPSAVSMNGR